MSERSSALSRWKSRSRAPACREAIQEMPARIIASAVISSARTPFTFSRTLVYAVKLVMRQPWNGMRESLRMTVSPSK